MHINTRPHMHNWLYACMHPTHLHQQTDRHTHTHTTNMHINTRPHMHNWLYACMHPTHLHQQTDIHTHTTNMHMNTRPHMHNCMHACTPPPLHQQTHTHATNKCITDELGCSPWIFSTHSRWRRSSPESWSTFPWRFLSTQSGPAWHNLITLCKSVFSCFFTLALQWWYEHFITFWFTHIHIGMCAHTHMHILSLSLSLTHTHTHLCYAHTLSHTHIHMLAHVCTHTLSHTHIYMLATHTWMNPWTHV